MHFLHLLLSKIRLIQWTPSNRNGLPATGSQNTNLISLVGFAVASVGSLMGLASSKKKQR